MGGPSCPVGSGRRVGQQILSFGRAHDRALAERRRLFAAGGEGTPLASKVGAFAASSDSNAFGDRRTGAWLSVEVVNLPIDRGRHGRAGAHRRSERLRGEPRAISHRPATHRPDGWTPARAAQLLAWRVADDL